MRNLHLIAEEMKRGISIKSRFPLGLGVMRVKKTYFDSYEMPPGKDYSYARPGIRRQLNHMDKLAWRFEKEMTWEIYRDSNTYLGLLRHMDTSEMPEDVMLVWDAKILNLEIWLHRFMLAFDEDF